MVCVCVCVCGHGFVVVVFFFGGGGGGDISTVELQWLKHWLLVHYASVSKLFLSSLEKITWLQI